ncbi:MAG: hypothetical protein ABJA71_09740 [Ginsengibacter sp.]
MKRSILFLVVFFLIINANAQLATSAVVQDEMQRPFIAAQSALYNEYLQPYRTSTTNMNSQKNKKTLNNFIRKLFIKFYGGYGFFTPGSYSVSSLNSIGWTKPDGIGHDTTVKTQAKRGIGGGSRFGFGIGLIQNDFLNIGLDAEYQHRNNLKNSLNTLVDDVNYATATDEMKYTAITLTPHVIFKALARPKFFIYNKLGILLTLPFTLSTSGNSGKSSITRLPHSDVFISADSTYRDVLLTMSDGGNSSYDTKYKMSLGIGLNVTFGINFRVTNKVRVFTEIFGNYSALSPASSLSSSYSKQHQSAAIDTTNFHFEIFSNKFSGTSTNYTTYKKGGAIALGISQYQDLGIDSEGYSQYKSSATGGTSHKYTINMAVLGVNVGFIYRF